MAKMKKSKIAWLIVATCLVTLGLVAVVVSIALAGFDYSDFSTVQYETNTYTLYEEFDDISIITDTTDVRIKPSDDENVKVVCYEESKILHSVIIADGTLKIEKVDSRKWYEHINIGINLDGSSITVYLPDKAYGDLSVFIDTGDTEIAEGLLFESIEVNSDTGDITNYAWAAGAIRFKASTGYITVKDVLADTLELKTTTGNVTLENVNCVGEITHKCSTGESIFENVNCNNFTSVGDTGDITLTALKAAERIAVERDTGKVRFDGSDAAELLIETSTGDVDGSLLTDKIFIVSTATGKIDVPESLEGGKCKITTSTGDVKLTVK